MKQLLFKLRLMNEQLAVIAGFVLLASVAVTILDIVLRRFGLSLGGTDEISGYAMAISTSWGISYALTNLAHVRIDLLRAQCASRGRALFDAIAILALSGTALVIAYRTWSVLSKTIKYHSTANTPLETPLWIPQSLWFAGWIWFALSAVIVLVGVVVFVFQGRFDDVDQVAGLRNEA
ncbi:MAG: TRAP transporter small permease [Cohaesibacteraceae bacterium]|nr:TRAP transporter small permease [Cohaesibacteraceae bacterium]MBL4876857.1 TRAP transporter small permease [Cohaesibacteraceae bacterium]